MFYYIEGKLAYLDPSFAVVDAGGVGYKLSISTTTYEAMPPHLTVSEPPVVRLFTHLAVREDGVELFGFGSDEELNAFRMLIGVSGVGPKAAMAILSILTPEKLSLAICSGDTKAISKAAGVGAKTAARIVLELQDKVTKQADVAPLASSLKASPASAASAASKGKLSEAMDALTVLGYSRSEATAALQAVDGSLEVEEMIRAALKRLMRNV